MGRCSVMTIRKNVRFYQTPLERLQLSHKLEQPQIVIHEQKNFYKVLFANPLVNEVVEREFLFNQNEVPFALVKSFIPNTYLKKGMNKGTNLEQLIDEFYQIKKIKKEYLLTWPTPEEAEILRIIGDGQVIIEKQLFLDKDNKVIRYEEEISNPEAYIYEE